VYRQVTELLAVPPGLIGFADDSAANVEAALGCGWNAVCYRSPARLRKSPRGIRCLRAGNQDN
jgi:FMN phosphatase YigB (HAD superfamily)